ncbi:GNAT family N-acetyltransferase [Pokkaliibacter plantistimulans]|nr:GNAT family N-acetyltransferase [Pokkaliibacter plantistimulans]
MPTTTPSTAFISYSNLHLGPQAGQAEQLQAIHVQQDGAALLVQLPAAADLQRFRWQAEQLHAPADASLAATLAALDYVFAQPAAPGEVVLQTAPELAAQLLRQGLGWQRQSSAEQVLLMVEAERFWQSPLLWLNQPLTPAFPQRYVMDANGRRHPLRPLKRNGTLYRRYIPWLGQTLSLRTLELDADLPCFNRWMNDPRVAHFWQEQGDMQQHREYLQKQAADPHSQTLIACFDEQPFAYFEVYWAREDRIAPFYQVEDYDRGWHLLVGEDAYRGRPWFSAWFPSLQHFLLLDDPRTQRIVAEPRHDNARLIGHAQQLGFANLKGFDFPHKRAQLLMLSRETFFSEQRWQPLPPR